MGAITQPITLVNPVSETRSSHNNPFIYVGCTLIMLFGDLFVDVSDKCIHASC